MGQGGRRASGLVASLLVKCHGCFSRSSFEPWRIGSSFQLPIVRKYVYHSIASRARRAVFPCHRARDAKIVRIGVIRHCLLTMEDYSAAVAACFDLVAVMKVSHIASVSPGSRLRGGVNLVSKLLVLDTEFFAAAKQRPQAFRYSGANWDIIIILKVVEAARNRVYNLSLLFRSEIRAPQHRFLLVGADVGSAHHIQREFHLIFPPLKTRFFGLFWLDSLAETADRADMTASVARNLTDGKAKALKSRSKLGSATKKRKEFLLLLILS